jgi:hypothetical protein
VNVVNDYREAIPLHAEKDNAVMINNENGVVLAPQTELFGGLFAPSDAAMRANRNKSGGIRVSLLPERSKKGPSLSSVLGLKGPALEAARERLEMEMKQRIGGLTGVVSASDEWRGVGYSVNAKRDRITATWVLRGKPSRESLKSTLTDDEVLELAIQHGIVDGDEDRKSAAAAAAAEK